jgi:hypothetical protein
MLDKDDVVGFLFIKGIEPAKRFDFVKEHDDTIRQLYRDPDKASSIWIGDVYIEYRPNVGTFDGVVQVGSRGTAQY